MKQRWGTVEDKLTERDCDGLLSFIYDVLRCERNVFSDVGDAQRCINDVSAMFVMFCDANVMYSAMSLLFQRCG